MPGSITDSPEYRALADKAANGSLSESEKVQWKQMQQTLAVEQATASNAAQGFKNQHYWNKVTLLKLQAPPTAQATLLSSPPTAEKAAAHNSGAEEARKRARLMIARGTLFNSPAGGLGGTTIPAGGGTPSLGGGRTLLS